MLEQEQKADLKNIKRSSRSCKIDFFESVARVWLRQGVQPPKRMGKASPGQSPLRLGRPSGQGKALEKTAHRIGGAPQFDAFASNL
jgi:hypothetical protein